MTEEQFKILLEYIDTRGKEIVGEQLGRDTLHDSVQTRWAREDLAVAFQLPKGL